MVGFEIDTPPRTCVRWLAAVLLALASSACAPRIGPTQRAPLARAAPGPMLPATMGAGANARAVALPLEQLPSRHIIVPVQVGGVGTVDFVLDTGANVSVITPAMRDRLGFDADEGVMVAGRGAGGSLGNVRLVEIERMRVGKRRYNSLMVAVMDLSAVEDRLDRPIGGLLGRNFLEQHVVEVDFVDQLLRFHPANAIARRTIDVSRLAMIPYQRFLSAGLIRVDATLDGSGSMPALVDLGAARTIMNWRAAAAVGVHPSTNSVHPSESLVGADQTPILGVHHTFDQLCLGGARFADPMIVVADLPVFETLGVDDAPVMIFGVDLLRGRRFVVDYGQQKLYVSNFAETPQIYPLISPASPQCG